jgi:hypothetical protein
VGDALGVAEVVAAWVSAAAARPVVVAVGVNVVVTVLVGVAVVWATAIAMISLAATTPAAETSIARSSWLRVSSGTDSDRIANTVV